MYASVLKISQAFPSAQWDPAQHEPKITTVEGWLEDWSRTLDAQIAGVVQTPVSPTASPNLAALCDQITALRVRADVYDARISPKPSEQVTTRQSQVWRRQADGLVAQIQAGQIADGVAAADGGPGTPVGTFGAGDERFGQREGLW